MTASGTVPANSSWTNRCSTACDQPGSLAERRVSVKRSGMTLVPVEMECQHNGSAGAFHRCARVSTDLAHKALGAVFKPIRVVVVREGPIDAMGRAARM